MLPILWESVYNRKLVVRAELKIVRLRKVKNPNEKFIAGLAELRRRTRETFMSAFSNESFSHEVCAEGTLPFRAVAQRLKQLHLRRCTDLITDACLWQP